MEAGEQALFIEHLQRIEARPGDRFVLLLPDKITKDLRQQIARVWDEFMPGCRLLVLDGGAKLGVIGEAERECGSSA